MITAAGSGSRLGADVPKALVRASGRTLLELALERVLSSPMISVVVVTCPADYVDTFRENTAHMNAIDRVSFVAGGNSRQSSVAAGLDELQRITGPSLHAETPVLVHDAARALTPTKLVEDLVRAVEDGAPAVVPGLPATDTIKTVDPSTNMVVDTPVRANLRIVQTPQAFRWGVLKKAHDEFKERGTTEANAATDDSAMVEEQGVPVLVVPGSPLAFKVTVPDDLARLERELSDS